METAKRQVAFKLWIRDVLSGNYVKEEGLRPNYVLLGNGQRVSRVNFIGAVVDVNSEGMQVFSLDDGTGVINVRAFEPLEKINHLKIGDLVFVIGRPRQFGNEIYLLPEIITGVKNPEWVEIRKLELGSQKQEKAPEQEEAVEEKDGTGEKIISFVRENDSGDGVSVEDINAEIPGAEKRIERLMLNGDLFEVRPGRLKVLE